MKRFIPILVSVILIFGLSAPTVYAVVTHYLTATNFGFNIPAGATIDGVVVEVEQKHTGGDPTVDHIRITVYYTEATAEETSQVRINGGTIRINGGTARINL